MNRLLAAGLFVIAAGATGPAFAATTATFQCGDTLVSGVFGLDELTLTIEDVEYIVPQVPAASGAKYEANGGAAPVLFWNSGDTAVLKVGDTAYPPCVRVKAAPQ